LAATDGSSSNVYRFSSRAENSIRSTALSACLAAEIWPATPPFDQQHFAAQPAGGPWPNAGMLCATFCSLAACAALLTTAVSVNSLCMCCALSTWCCRCVRTARTLLTC
jgi:hypothetical protein